MYAKNLISGDVAFDILVKSQRAATDDGKLEIKQVRGKFLLFHCCSDNTSEIMVEYLSLIHI